MRNAGICLLAAMACAFGALAQEAKQSEQKMEPNKGMVYTIKRAAVTPELKGKWDGPAWSVADTAEVNHFHPQSNDHHPVTLARVLYDDKGIYVMFKVKDKYVRSTATGYQSRVCSDACAEFFVQPKPGKGYFNFEMNCGGQLLLFYITDPTRTTDGFKERKEVDWNLAKEIRIYHSLPAKVYPERKKDTEWRIEYFVPRELFEHYVGPLGDLAGQEWRGNFFKCADKSSHPHWATWAPIGEELNFHQPKFFGTMKLEK